MRKIALIALAVVPAALAAAQAQDAKQILDATGVKGGLVVVVGCGDPALLTGLRPSESYLVHGLDTVIIRGKMYLLTPPLRCPKKPNEKEAATRLRYRFRNIDYVPGL